MWGATPRSVRFSDAGRCQPIHMYMSKISTAARDLGVGEQQIVMITDRDLVFPSIPEPATLALPGLDGLILTLGRRR